MTSATAFDDLPQALDEGGVSAVLDRLVDTLRGEQKYPELFEALKMQVRHRLGLPIAYSEGGDDLTPEVRDQLETGLLDACREVGLALVRQGRVHDGWQYLRPTGENELVAAELRKLEIDDDNLEDIVNVALHEGVEPALGYGVMLEHYGTCNSITAYEQIVPLLPPADQRAVTSLLVNHVYEELLATVQADIAQQQGSEPGERSPHAKVVPTASAASAPRMGCRRLRDVLMVPSPLG